MKRILIVAAALAVLLGAASPSSATWIWRNNRWIQVDEPDAPTQPQTSGERPKATPIAPSSDAATTPPAPTAPVASPVGPALSRQAAADLRPAVMPTDVGKRTGSAVPEPGLEGELIELGRTQLAGGDFKTGAKTLRRVINDYPDSRQREEAMWLRAAALLADGDHYASFEQLEELVTQYAGSVHFQEALAKEMMIAEAFMTGTKRKQWGMTVPFSAADDGIAILRKVYEHQPTGALAAAVVQRVADYYWDGHRWNDAEDYYDKYCREFPNGPAVQQAEYRRAKCTIERCRGPLYDTTGLQTAYDRLSQFKQKYPDEAGRENVEGLLANIRDVQAQSLYETAAHYRRAGHPKAAAAYAERLRERYPESPWAEQAMIFLPPEMPRDVLPPGPIPAPPASKAGTAGGQPVKEEPKK